jgi:hypothetical protein
MRIANKREGEDVDGAPGEQALFMAVPLRHLEAAVAIGPLARVLLPAGGPGDLDSATPGMTLLMMATDAGESERPAATWSAVVVRRVPYELGQPWPEGLPATWLVEHAPAPFPQGALGVPLGAVGTPEEDDWDADEDDGDEDDEDDGVGPQSFVEVAGLAPLDRRDWVFANELVRKQARGGRSFRPRVPMLVRLPY